MKIRVLSATAIAAAVVASVAMSPALAAAATAPGAPGDPNAAITYSLGNEETAEVDQRAVIHAGFLDLVRLGVLPASDPTIRSSLTVVDDTIERQTPSGPGFYRYGYSPTESTDGHGDC